MDVREALDLRLAATGLSRPRHTSPADVVRGLLAVQSQDVRPSAWSIGVRCGADEAAVQECRRSGLVLRTHVLRTTWHDVAAEDLRWLVALTAPRVRRQLAAARRQHGIDDQLLARARRLLEPALAQQHLTRAQVTDVLAAGGLDARGPRLGHLLMHLELDAFVCSGEPAGRSSTHALVDERCPTAPPRDQEQAVAELVLRFLQGHGPAAVQDVSWWSSLLVTDVRAALAGLGDAVTSEDVDGTPVWRAVDAPGPAPAPGVQLVQLYDEHLVAFPATKAWADPERTTSVRQRPFLGVVLEDGVFAGSWGCAAGSSVVRVETDLEPDRLADAVAAYARFTGRALRLG